MFICSHGGLRTRQGHYTVQRSEKVGKAEEKQGWSSQKSLGDSLSELLTRQKIQPNQSAAWRCAKWNGELDPTRVNDQNNWRMKSSPFSNIYRFTNWEVKNSKAEAVVWRWSLPIGGSPSIPKVMISLVDGAMTWHFGSFWQHINWFLEREKRILHRFFPDFTYFTVLNILGEGFELRYWGFKVLVLILEWALEILKILWIIFLVTISCFFVMLG